ncbi:FtsX-like permease family protein [Nocardioides speluncae]|uniref:FtsX-like permease family protein n=1 Tax=Nocardioides speluncae TaxID=2670337 RepID=UPI000D69937B|nr:FtsX-like permease family protein [Nocardioides speluncae]
MRGWRPLLRLAWRDARRARGRSILVLVMIALPVMAVTAADVVIATQDVTSAESLDRRLGSADALVSVDPYSSNVIQSFDPDDGMGSSAGAQEGNGHTFADVRRVLGFDTRSLELRDGEIRVTTDMGVASAMATEVDATDPMTTGMFRLSAGHYPKSDDEAVVNQALADRGFSVGDRLEVVDGHTLTVVGIAESGSFRNPAYVLARPGALGLTDETGRPRWLVETGPVSWDEVRELNKLGATVLSRSVIENPPPKSELPPEITTATTDDAWLAIVVLVVSMALLEVVLLAGPAFAVSARRQSRTIALMAATGATPEQARRLVLAGGIVLGGIAAVAGVAIGIVVGWLAAPLVQGLSDSRFGPFDVPWLHLLGIAAFGLASAVLAAVVPASIASRQDVVAVLAGRRGDRRPSLRSPILGLALLGAGIAASVYGANQTSMGEVFIAGSAVVAVLGMLLLVPVAIVGLARISRRLPLPLRFAVRDAARHRTRTVPAVAAVAATVAGVVALGIAVTSDAAEAEATYTEQLPTGMAQVTGFYSNSGRIKPGQWDRYAAVVAGELPEHRVVRVSGVPEDETVIGFKVPGAPTLLTIHASALGSSVLVDDELPAGLGIQEADRTRAGRALARGDAVVLADQSVAADQVTVLVERFSDDGASTSSKHERLPAVFVQPEGQVAMAQAVLPPAVAERIGLEVATVSLLIDGPVTESAETDLQEALAAVSPDASLYVERGYRAEDATVIVQLVLAVLGGVLMLGGTLTATFLALSDARPDLATLAAVGAAPRSRRLVGAAYALVVGLVGAVLGAAVGFIPGIAITYPLTSNAWTGSGPEGMPSHYLDVPWLLILGLVVGLPLLTATVVGLSARSRLPTIARID